MSKVLGLFNLIQFSNSRCNSTDSDKQGVCYTATECRGRGGTAKGNCAQGFGVCCLCKYRLCFIQIEAVLRMDVLDIIPLKYTFT